MRGLKRVVRLVAVERDGAVCYQAFVLRVPSIAVIRSVVLASRPAPDGTRASRTDGLDTEQLSPRAEILKRLTRFFQNAKNKLSSIAFLLS